MNFDERVDAALQEYAATIEFERPNWSELLRRAEVGDGLRRWPRALAAVVTVL